MKFKTILASTLLAFSSITFANGNGVMMEMFQMKKQLNVLLEANNKEDFQAAASTFLKVSEKARETVPASFDGDTTRMPEYQKAMDDVMNVVKQANDLAAQDKLDEAKSTIEQLNDMKKKYHKEFK